jgi:Fic family protein
VSIDFRIPVTQEILATISRIDRFQGEWSSGTPLSAERLASLKKASMIQSIASSCRLTGIHVSENDVAGLLQDGSSALPDADAVHGYAAAMNESFAESAKLLSAAHLERINALILGHSGGGESQSLWRTEPLHREAFDAHGRVMSGWVFPTLPPHLIKEKTEDLLTWIEFELRQGERHPALVIAAFVLAFLAISPFARANGRTARVMMGLLLQRAGYTYIPYASLESRIEGSREAYLEALMQARARLWSGDADIEPWLLFFLKMMDSHRERLETKLALERQAQTFPPLQREILETVREHGSVDAALLLRATGANRNTLKDNLRRMVNRGVLEKTGQRRGTRYQLAVFDRPNLDD